jgi:acetyl-CoA acetyltransferase
MSQTPYYLPKARFGAKYGNQEMVDGIVQDGLWDVYNKFLMGNAAELCAKEHGFTREDQVSIELISSNRALHCRLGQLRHCQLSKGTKGSCRGSLQGNDSRGGQRCQGQGIQDNYG